MGRALPPSPPKARQAALVAQRAAVGRAFSAVNTTPYLFVPTSDRLNHRVVISTSP